MSSSDELKSISGVQPIDLPNHDWKIVDSILLTDFLIGLISPCYKVEKKVYLVTPVDIWASIFVDIPLLRQAWRTIGTFSNLSFPPDERTYEMKGCTNYKGQYTIIDKYMFWRETSQIIRSK
jgi:hypothetical protein